MAVKPLGQAAARCGVDFVLTGHGCSFLAGISEAPIAPLVAINGFPAAVYTQPLFPHTINDGDSCVPHLDIIKTGSTLVFSSRIPMARIGDLADVGGVVITGSPTVFIGGPPGTAPYLGP